MEVMIYIVPAIVVFLIFLGIAKNCEGHNEDERRHVNRGHSAPDITP